MFVSEILPNLWVCDYDVIKTSYFNTRNIGLFIHVYSFHSNYNLKTAYNQELVEIKIKDINTKTRYSNNELIQRQIMRYSKYFADLIHENIGNIEKFLKNMRGVVIYSEHGIQKAATVAAAYLISKGHITAGDSIKVMKSKEPLFFKNPENIQYNRYDDMYIVLYEYALSFIENLFNS